ncbi:MAG: methionyl-tRNA formyltransferase [Gammaproteobacteria bacterium]
MSPGLNIAFAGTPELAATILKSLVEDSPHQVSSVYTQPDRPAGRGRRLQQSPVKLLAQQYQLPVLQPGNPTELESDNNLETVDVLVVAAYGMILPETVLNKPRFGAINIHTSLLPRWRGAAPVQRAILAGDTETGITIMQMDPGLDSGDILFQRGCPITTDDTTGTLLGKLSNIGSECILIILDKLMNGSLQPVPQADDGVTYAHKIKKSEAVVDWNQPALEIDRQIRAFNPAPVATATLNNQSLRIWQAVVLDQANKGASPGSLVNYSAAGLDIATGDQILRVLRLQLPGKKVVTCRDFFNGNPGFWQN